MKTALINFLFRLLGNTNSRPYTIGYLFGSTTQNHEARKKRWEKSLARLWKDKDLLDYLYYQAESDKENIFRGKINSDLSRGARIRTLFIVYSARRAFMNELKAKRTSAQDKSDTDVESKKVAQVYKQLVDIG